MRDDKYLVREYQHGDSRKFKPKDLYLDPEVAHSSIETISKRSDCCVFTVVLNGDPVAVITSVPIAPGIAELMALLSDRVYECPIYFARTCVRCMTYVQNKLKLHRYQTVVRSDCKDLHRWAKFLGMHKEANLEKFYDKMDHTLYARVY